MDDHENHQAYELACAVDEFLNGTIEDESAGVVIHSLISVAGWWIERLKAADKEDEALAAYAYATLALSMAVNCDGAIIDRGDDDDDGNGFQAVEFSRN